MPIWGAVPTKFTLQAGLLLISARIDLHPIRAIVDPSQPMTIVDEKAARFLGIPYTPDTLQAVASDRDLGIDHSTRRLRQALPGKMTGADVIIGTDVLRRTVILLDFKKHRLRVPATAHEAARLERGMIAVPAEQTSDGCLGVTGSNAGGATQIALMGDGGTAASDKPVTLGATAVDASADVGRCTASRLAIRWQDFGDRRIVLDLAKDRLWLSR